LLSLGPIILGTDILIPKGSATLLIDTVEHRQLIFTKKFSITYSEVSVDRAGTLNTGIEPKLNIVLKFFALQFLSTILIQY